MKGLAPLGVTNDRLDEVSKPLPVPAAGRRTLEKHPGEGVRGRRRRQGTVGRRHRSGVRLQHPAQGHGPGDGGVALKATLHLDKNLKTNGSIASVAPADPKPAR